MKQLEQGLTARLEMTVGDSDLACVHGSGSLPVYATPAMVAFMEKTACALLAPYMEDGETTVGIDMAVKHLKATVKGRRVVCTARLVEQDGRKTVFDIEAKEEDAVTIGKARHERFCVLAEPFMQKAAAAVVAR
ncbi:MAG: thioesterase family protein [Bacteroidales bacterium]|nr:thioesterase family protein [Bacteroidales bacterium]